MTEFRIEPIQQVIIHDLVHENMENFLHQCYVTNQVSAIWVDGVIILLIPLNSSKISAEQSTKNLKYFERVSFVKYLKYTQSVKWSGGNYELILRNYKNFPRFIEFAKWIKTQPQWKLEQEIIA